MQPELIDTFEMTTAAATATPHIRSAKAVIKLYDCVRCSFVGISSPHKYIASLCASATRLTQLKNYFHLFTTPFLLYSTKSVHHKYCGVSKSILVCFIEIETFFFVEKGEFMF